MMRTTEVGTLYLQSTKENPLQNVIPGYYAAIFTGLKCNIQRGSKDSKNDIASLGIDIDEGAVGYCPITYRNWIRSNLLISTRPKEFWRIAGEPSCRDRLSRTAHIRFILQLQTQAPHIAT